MNPIKQIWFIPFALLAAGCPDTSPSADAGSPPGRWFWSPQGITATTQHVLVANTASYIEGGKVHFGQAFITLIHRKSRKVVGRVETSWLNTQIVKVCGHKAYALSSGKYQVDNGLIVPASPGGVDALDLSGGVPTSVEAKIPLGLSTADPRIGNFGSMVISPDCKLAYLGSGTRADVFSLDLANNKVVRGPDSPVALFSTTAGNNGMSIVRPWDSGLAVVDFNSEQLCLSTDWGGSLAQRTCGSIKVDKDVLAGPIDVARAPDGLALVLMSMANALYTMDLSKLPYTVKAKLAVTGLANNRVLVHKGQAYVINSLSANLQRVELPSGKSTLPLTVFPTQSNPYDMVITAEATGDVAWVTLSRVHQLALVDLATGKILQVLKNPATADGGSPDAASVDGPAADSQWVDTGAGETAPGDQGPQPDGGSFVVGIHSVEAVTYGQGGGFGKAKLPGVVQGGPQGGGTGGSSTDVLSLGVKGEVVVGFGAFDIVDGPGPDLIVFENPFLLSPYASYAEPGAVAVSSAGTAAQDFVEFACDLTTKGDPSTKTWPYPGCAGVQPVLANVKTNSISPADPKVAGGDLFDLAKIGVKQARYLRIRDSGVSLMGTDTRGFDLDAVVLINYKKVR